MTQNPLERLGINLGRASRLMRTKLDERLGRLGLTQAKWLILMYLSRNGGTMPQKELTESIGVEGPTVVRVLDGLERLGCIKRCDRPDDRRTKDVCLTEAASPLLGEIRQITEAFRREAWFGIADEDLAVCDRVMTSLLGNLSNLPHG
jgi:MarR family transcriptional regulator, transcriptional regulator for hemolysin